jgi:hypothetical protein
LEVKDYLTLRGQEQYQGLALEGHCNLLDSPAQLAQNLIAAYYRMFIKYLPSLLDALKCKLLAGTFLYKISFNVLLNMDVHSIVLDTSYHLAEVYFETV